MLHVIQRNLARGRGRGDGGVSQRASFTQSENSSGKADFAHGRGDKIFRVARQAQQPKAVVDGARFRGDLHGVDAPVGWRVYSSGQIRRAIEIVERKHDAPRHWIFAQGLAGGLAQGFYFHIPPLSARFAGLNQPMELVVDTTREFPDSFAASTRGGKSAIAKFLFLTPTA